MLRRPRHVNEADETRSRRRGRTSHARAIVVVITLASAAAGALAGCHPTGTAGVDEVYAAALAAAVTLAASQARRAPTLVMAAVAVAFSRSWLWIPSGAALTLAFASTFHGRRHQRSGALIGAVAVQVVLRWPARGFHGLTAIAAAVVVIPVLVSGWRNIRRRLRGRILLGAGVVAALAVVFSAPVAWSALSARHPVEQGVSLARTSLDQVEQGQSPSATAQLHQAAADLATARARVTGPWDLAGYLVPVVAQQERALADSTRAGARLTAVAAAEGPTVDVQALRYSGGRIDLGALTDLRKPVADLDAALTATRRALYGSRSPWLISPITSRMTSLEAQVDRAANSVGLAALAVQDGPALLGGDGVRHYFVAFMTPAETRGLGGFIGAYGILTVDNGSIKLTASGRATDLVPKPNPNLQLTGPPDYLARYGAFQPQDNVEDVTYSPDLPSVEQVLAGLYPQIAGMHIDGVMVLDPDALAALLRFTGPIAVPGVTDQLSSANAADVLLRSQYLTDDTTASQRHDVLQAALQVGFRQLTAGSLPSPKALSAVLDPEVRQGRLLFWTSHPEDQPLLRRLGLSGAFPAAGSGDLLAVTLSNSGNSKIDAYLHQQTADSVRYDPATGEVTSTVTITLDNAAPSSGLPAYVIGSHFPAGVGPGPGTSYLWLSLYTPLTLQAATVEGAPAVFGVPVDEDGVRVYSAYITIPAHTTSTVVATLHGRVAPGTYHLTARLQPLANPQTFSVRVSPPPGWLYLRPSTPAWTAGTDEVQTHTWAFGR